MNVRNIAFACAVAGALVAGCDGTSPAGVDGGPEPDGGSTPECPTGTLMCGDACVDTDNDRAHCGACDAACPTGEACIDGACGIVCPASQTECDGACADLTSDRRHCGACGTACADGEICADSSCEVSCPSGQTVCGGACVNTDTDPAHCGGCDSPCASGEVCSAGSCAGSCGALTDCSGACVDTSHDPGHCGACDAACPTATAASGLCMDGTCRLVCDLLAGDCNADLGGAGGDGCETPLATDAANCGACGRTCSFANAVGGCAAGACTIAMCDANYGNCDGATANGCETDVSDDELNCGACGTVCTGTDECIDGACVGLVGDTCTDVVALTTGINTFTWRAAGTSADYLTFTPSCVAVGTVTGPDIVLSYTATADEVVTLSFDKPTNTRWVAVPSTGACGTLSPGLGCLSEYTDPTMTGSFPLRAGETAYIYVSDTTSGTAPLDNPLTVTVSSTACTSAPAPTPTTFEPASGATTTTLSPVLRVTFDAAVIPYAGTVSIAGSMGSSASYDLSTSPPEVSFNTANTIMTITPASPFLAGEALTITATGMLGAGCAEPVATFSWMFTTTVPPCTPGAGGVVGTTVGTMVTGVASFTEYYVAADASPTGYVYFGGTANLYRVPKAGGAVEDVEALAALTTSHMGYTMLVDGLDIYVVNETTSGTTGRLFRISTDGGATWSVQDYATFPTAPSDDFRGIASHGGRLYMVTEEDTTGTATEIWSVPAGAATVPATATLELSIAGERDCSAITRDASFYYLTCYGVGDDRLVRVPVAGGAPVLITDAFTMSSTNNALHGDDLDADGVFDVLYMQLASEEAYYVCSPAGAMPYVDVLVNFGTGTTNYGLGFDSTANRLWMIDDDNRDLVSID